MIKALTVAGAGALLLASGCTSHAGASDTPEQIAIKGMIAKLGPVMPCGRPEESDGYARVNCDNGSAFIEAYPDAATIGSRLLTVAGSGGGYVLIGDDQTWLARADMTDSLERMKTYLGGRTLHIEYREPQS